MSGRSFFREKQLRVCVVAALTSVSATVAESLVLPPKPLASNISWGCESEAHSGLLCGVAKVGIQARGIQSELAVSSDADLLREMPLPQQTGSIFVDIGDGRYATTWTPAVTESVEASDPVTGLMRLPGDHYVLQWMAAKEPEALEALKERYPVLKDSVIAKYERGGKLWYVLLDGPYENQKQAVALLDAPPRSHMARELYPWTRSLASIQKLNLLGAQPSNERLAKADHTGHHATQAASTAPEKPADVQSTQSTYKQVAYDTDLKQSLVQNPSSHSHNRQTDGHRDTQGVSNRTTEKLSIADVDVKTAHYGNKLDNEAYDSYQSEQTYRVESDVTHSQNIYANISSSYGEIMSKHYLQNSLNHDDHQRADVSYPRQSSHHTYENDGLSQHAINVLTANPRSFTIEWMNASRKESLERVRLRYDELRDTQIIHYKQNNKNRYALVSKLFINRSDAMDALLNPILSRMSVRFSPKIRQVGWLQTKVTSNSELRQTRTTQINKPSISKKQWIDTYNQKYKTRVANNQGSDRNTIKQSLMSSSDVYTPSTQKPLSIINHNQEINQHFGVQNHHQSDHSVEKTENDRQINALINGPKNSYTIQWFSSNNRKSIEQLKKRFPELSSAVTINIQRNNKEWYVLVQGQYRNSQEALMALKSHDMKNIAMILHPWTRPVESLKKLQIAGL